MLCGVCILNTVFHFNRHLFHTVWPIGQLNFTSSRFACKYKHIPTSVRQISLSEESGVFSICKLVKQINRLIENIIYVEKNKRQTKTTEQMDKRKHLKKKQTNTKTRCFAGKAKTNDGKNVHVDTRDANNNTCYSSAEVG